jgi:YjbE family integral membrane protein
VDFILADLTQPAFWAATGQIIGINVILSGDNAVVIALACRTLPQRQRLWGTIIGAGVAIVLRILFTFVVTQAMEYPLLKLAGGALLLWIAVKLVAADERPGGTGIEAADTLWRAVRIVAIADVVMSLDNVIAIAASAETAAAGMNLEHATLLKAELVVFGLATSIPLIVAGSALLLALLERFPVLVWAGAGLLGWIAGNIMINDPALVIWFPADIVAALRYWAAAGGAALVLALGYVLIRAKPAPDDVNKV